MLAPRTRGNLRFPQRGRRLRPRDTLSGRSVGALSGSPGADPHFPISEVPFSNNAGALLLGIGSGLPAWGLGNSRLQSPLNRQCFTRGQRPSEANRDRPELRHQLPSDFHPQSPQRPSGAASARTGFGRFRARRGIQHPAFYVGFPSGGAMSSRWSAKRNPNRKPDRPSSQACRKPHTDTLQAQPAVAATFGDARPCRGRCRRKRSETNICTACRV